MSSWWLPLRKTRGLDMRYLSVWGICGRCLTRTQSRLNGKQYCPQRIWLLSSFPYCKSFQTFRSVSYEDLTYCSVLFSNIGFSSSVLFSTVGLSYCSVLFSTSDLSTCSVLLPTADLSNCSVLFPNADLPLARSYSLKNYFR